MSVSGPNSVVQLSTVQAHTTGVEDVGNGAPNTQGGLLAPVDGVAQSLDTTTASEEASKKRKREDEEESIEESDPAPDSSNQPENHQKEKNRLKQRSINKKARKEPKSEASAALDLKDPNNAQLKSTERLKMEYIFWSGSSGTENNFEAINLSRPWLILDLDETLIHAEIGVPHSSFASLSRQYDFVYKISVPPGTQIAPNSQYFGHIRPYAPMFLSWAKDWCAANNYVFALHTWSQPWLCKKVVERLGGLDLFDIVLSRSELFAEEFATNPRLQKNLLHYIPREHVANSIIVDDRIDGVFQKYNQISPPRYEGLLTQNYTDDSLSRVKYIIETAKHIKDNIYKGSKMDYALKVALTPTTDPKTSWLSQFNPVAKSIEQNVYKK